MNVVCFMKEGHASVFSLQGWNIMKCKEDVQQLAHAF